MLLSVVFLVLLFSNSGLSPPLGLFLATSIPAVSRLALLFVDARWLGVEDAVAIWILPGGEGGRGVVAGVWCDDVESFLVGFSRMGFAWLWDVRCSAADFLTLPTGRLCPAVTAPEASRAPDSSSISMSPSCNRLSLDSCAFVETVEASATLSSARPDTDDRPVSSSVCRSRVGS